MWPFKPAWKSKRIMDVERAVNNITDPKLLQKIIDYYDSAKHYDFSCRKVAEDRLAQLEINQLNQLDENALKAMLDRSNLADKLKKAVVERLARFRSARVDQMEDQQALAALATHDPSEEVRCKAMERLSDEELIANVLGTITSLVTNKELKVCHALLTRITQQDLLAHVVQKSGNDSLRCKAISRLDAATQRPLFVKLITDADWQVLPTIVARLDIERDADLLAEIAKLDGDEVVKKAIAKIDDRVLLRDIAANAVGSMACCLVAAKLDAENDRVLLAEIVQWYVDRVKQATQAAAVAKQSYLVASINTAQAKLGALLNTLEFHKFIQNLDARDHMAALTEMAKVTLQYGEGAWALGEFTAKIDGPEYQSLLAEMACHAQDETVGQTAASKVTDETLLLQITKKARKETVAIAAARRIKDKALLVKAALCSDFDVTMEIVEKLLDPVHDQLFLAQIIKSEKAQRAEVPHWITLINVPEMLIDIAVSAVQMEVRKAAIKALDADAHQALLADIARKVLNSEVTEYWDAIAAIERLDTERNRDLLLEIARDGFYDATAEAALARLDDGQGCDSATSRAKEAADGGKAPTACAGTLGAAFGYGSRLCGNVSRMPKITWS